MFRVAPQPGAFTQVATRMANGPASAAPLASPSSLASFYASQPIRALSGGEYGRSSRLPAAMRTRVIEGYQGTLSTAFAPLSTASHSPALGIVAQNIERFTPPYTMRGFRNALSQMGRLVGAGIAIENSLVPQVGILHTLAFGSEALRMDVNAQLRVSVVWDKRLANPGTTIDQALIASGASYFHCYANGIVGETFQAESYRMLLDLVRGHAAA